MNFSTISSDSSEDEFLYIRRPIAYSERINYINQYYDISFYERFRLTKETFMSLLEQIEPLIKLPTNRGGAVTPLQQLLLTLRFFASGSMHVSVADYMGISRATASRTIKRVSAAIASLSRQYIKMYETNDEMVQAPEEFYAIARFPRCIGAIDCTLIRIDSPGGLHDARTEAENLYNESLIRTRNVVERQYGVWKRRFPILRNGMRLNLDVTMNLIVATALLHNIAIEDGDLFPVDLNLDQQEDNLPQYQGNLY
ncbi:uncharacterized protein [Diabrotica undecimpunctata]|uniref:uncharacterized protein n=1 Tax=Diabrotica undecimpunctata TaxID=50387 RepID=UPI003B63B718